MHIIYRNVVRTGGEGNEKNSENLEKILKYWKKYNQIIIIWLYRFIHIWSLHMLNKIQLDLIFMNMQNFAKIGDIDHYSLHSIHYFSVINSLSNPSTYTLLIL